MHIQMLDTEHGVIEIPNAIDFSQTRTMYKIKYWIPGSFLVFSIKKDKVLAIWVNGSPYTVVLI